MAQGVPIKLVTTPRRNNVQGNEGKKSSSKLNSKPKYSSPLSPRLDAPLRHKYSNEKEASKEKVRCGRKLKIIETKVMHTLYNVACPVHGFVSTWGSVPPTIRECPKFILGV